MGLLSRGKRKILRVQQTLYLFFARRSVISGFIDDCRIGSMVKVSRGVVVRSSLGDWVRLRGNNIIINSNIGRYTYFQPGSIASFADIGSFCSIAESARLGAPNHDYSRFTTHEITYNPEFRFITAVDNKFEEEVAAKRCKIGNDVWVGHGAIILPSRSVGDGAVVGAGAVVTKDVPPYAVVAGNPAHFVKWRFDELTRGILLDLNWWTWPDDEIRRHLASGGSLSEFLNFDTD